MESTGTNLLLHKLNLLTAFCSALLAKTHVVIFPVRLLFKRWFQDSVFGDSCYQVPTATCFDMIVVDRLPDDILVPKRAAVGTRYKLSFVVCFIVF
jgi:hypothetical protein